MAKYEQIVTDFLAFHQPKAIIPNLPPSKPVAARPENG
jgi:hypothetical protein